MHEKAKFLSFQKYLLASSVGNCYLVHGSRLFFWSLTSWVGIEEWWCRLLGNEIGIALEYDQLNLLVLCYEVG